MNIKEANAYIKKFDEKIQKPSIISPDTEFYVGVDLGTANIVISVVDKNGEPLGGATYPSSVVKDGIVVDFIGAIKIVRDLKGKVEKDLGIEITEGFTAIPPGVEVGSVKAISNVIESAEIDVVRVIDEPTAAAKTLKITDGAVVDVGGGTTGISILKDGKVIFVADEPTGGTHMSLVLAGNYGITFDEAEELKKDKSKENEIFTTVKPVVEKMAAIVKKFLSGYDVDTIYLVGGACTFKGFDSVFEKELGKKIVKTYKPLLVTPLGIALTEVQGKA
ncbi:ethanolamine utilization protein EutJ [Ilyobacter polytropus]|uniref:Ethanolamine utilization protein EutJ family protein n=1 Tax=Ilyobacter polytropus (strain ATCC 51220 / DSM 2926 / LMG 16218 / CuHBu1) TaxID=572544 RepID=E3HDC0_ILYPC|nr:ethanolamine utilization protein EutJ [Ilyobacter polytropus]ADO84120.1 ethanolamine utilization protein EutJ family protein [Ilyobacter polytropus DSM 2926]